MRGLLRASLLLAPLVASALSIIEDVELEYDGIPVDDEPMSRLLVVFDTKDQNQSESADTTEALSFHLDVHPSDRICGFGNITINGQALPQEITERGSTGNGSLIADGDKIIFANWDFECVEGLEAEAVGQSLQFSIESIDGKPARNRVTVFFQQDIPRILTHLLIVDEILPSDSMSDEEDGLMNFEDYNIEEEMAQLEWMKAAVQELEYQIYQKEEAVAMYISYEMENSYDCDSLKCVLKSIYRKIRATTYRIYSSIYTQIAGDNRETEDDELEGSLKPPHRKRPPHWRPPHRRRPPHCRPPHWKRPPHWRKPPHWKKPPCHHPHGNHSHHNHTCHPPHGNHSHPHPPHWCRPRFRLPPACGCPPHRTPHRKPHGSPLPPDRHPHQPPLHDGPPPPPEGELNPAPPHKGEDPKRLGPKLDPPFIDHRFRRRHKIRVLLSYLAAGAIVSFLIAAVHRRCYSKARRQARRARREERHRRRAFKRAAYKHAWRSWFIRHFGSRSQEELDYEEKRAAIATESEEHDGDVVASEISQLLNATTIVEQIIAAEEGRASVDSRSSLPDYKSELGAGEQLPAYEDNDGSELSLAIADGFMYTPGTSDYTPGSSEAGSVSNVLGDIKE